MKLQTNRALKRAYASSRTHKTVSSQDTTYYTKRLLFAATHALKDIYAYTASAPEGLTTEEANTARAHWGTNEIKRAHTDSFAKRAAQAFLNPFSAILLCLAVVSFVNDVYFPLTQSFGFTQEDLNPTTVIVIVSMVLIAGILRLSQEGKSAAATKALLDMITTTATVVRDSHVQEIPISELVVGDIVRLRVGDMVPADIRICDERDLFVNQASLTGESEPQEKLSCKISTHKDVLGYANLAFMGTDVIAGTATGIVINTGTHTVLGQTSEKLTTSKKSSFDEGITSVSWVLIRFMAVMVPLVFLINGAGKQDWLSAFLFAISVAVGLTPEMLPMIVTTCLAKGALAMSRKQTVVKRLDAIQAFGAMDILCTDKTGTLTQNNIVLEYHLNIHGKDDSGVLRCAYLNSYFQTGYKNLIDKAIIDHTEEEEEHNEALTDLSVHFHKLDEIPFDFSRRRLSVLVEGANSERIMVTKGAVEEMFSVCAYAQDEDRIVPLDNVLKEEIRLLCTRLNDEGFRVLGLAKKTDVHATLTKEDEHSMIFMGYLAFLDPPKQSCAQAIAALRTHGVSTKILTGDNEKVTRTICAKVGLEVSGMLLGQDIERMSDEELERRSESCVVFAKLTPTQKARVVSVLKHAGHTVGYMGDGINDAPAMKEADIGISVDTAVDIAKESADIVLLQKDLLVLEEGIVEGRKTYINMVKYIKLCASSNFGNMFSVLAASLLLPFLPMQSLHLIILNLIFDLTCTAIPWDRVDHELIRAPRAWDASSISSFMMWMGPISSIFDFATFAFLFFVLCPMIVSHGVVFGDLASVFEGADLYSVRMAYIALFQTGWFVESMWSQTLVVHMIRTPKIPFIQSSPSTQLICASVAGIGVLTLIPYTPIAPALGLCALPAVYFVYLFACVVAYMLLASVVKVLYIKKHHELL